MALIALAQWMASLEGKSLRTCCKTVFLGKRIKNIGLSGWRRGRGKNPGQQRDKRSSPQGGGWREGGRGSFLAGCSLAFVWTSLAMGKRWFAVLLQCRLDEGPGRTLSSASDPGLPSPCVASDAPRRHPRDRPGRAADIRSVPQRSTSNGRFRGNLVGAIAPAERKLTAYGN